MHVTVNGEAMEIPAGSTVRAAFFVASAATGSPTTSKSINGCFISASAPRSSAMYSGVSV